MRIGQWTLGALLIVITMIGASSAVAQTSADLAQVMPSVVRVSLVGRTEAGGFYLHSVGSGFVAARERVVTNSHVVRDALEQQNLFVVITPHQGFGNKLIIGRVIRENTAADLALIDAPDLNAPSARIALPPGHTGIVNAVGYPALMCDVLDCSADERIAPSVPDFSSGPITRFAERTPRGGDVKTIFHRAAISGGNSGGPIVDQCGRVVGVNAWTSAAYLRGDGSIEAPTAVSIATHAEPLIQFLTAAGVVIQRDDQRCRTAEDVNNELQKQLEDLKNSVAAQETARAEAAEADAQAKRRERRTLLASIGIGGAGLVGLIAAIAAVIWFRRRASRSASGATSVAERSQGRSVTIALATIAAAAIIGAALYMAITSQRSAPKAATAATAEPSIVALVCTLDQARSIAHPTTSDAMEVEFDESRSCVNNRTPYQAADDGFDRVIVSTQEPKVTLNHFDKDLSAFVQDSYIVTEGAWDELRTKAAQLTKGCAVDTATQAAQASLLEDLRAGTKGRLAAQPVRRSAWVCRRTG